MRRNPETKGLLGYFRLLESYCNQNGNVCQRTMLSEAYLEELNAEQLNIIQKKLSAKVINLDNPLFELPYSDDVEVLDYVEHFFNRMVVEKRIDIP